MKAVYRNESSIHLVILSKIQHASFTDLQFEVVQLPTTWVVSTLAFFGVVMQPRHQTASFFSLDEWRCLLLS